MNQRWIRDSAVIDKTAVEPAATQGPARLSIVQVPTRMYSVLQSGGLSCAALGYPGAVPGWIPISRLSDLGLRKS